MTNGQKRSAVDAAWCASASSSKRLRIASGPRGRSAAEEFFSIPELIIETGRYLQRDRIDLIALASVKRSCRVHAFGLWAEHLDLPLSRITSRFRLFAANPSFLSYIKHIRIRNELGHTAESSALCWQDFMRLIAVLGTQPSILRHPPSFDISIELQNVSEVEAAFSPFKHLMASIVALTIWPNPRTSAGNIPQQSRSKAAEGGSKEGRQKHMMQDLATWIYECQSQALAHQKTGLLSFTWGYGQELLHINLDRECPLLPDTWTMIAQSLRWSLQQLSLLLAQSDATNDIISCINFPGLQSLLIRHHLTDSHGLDKVLSKHQELRSIVIQRCSGEDHYLHHALLPNLRRAFVFTNGSCGPHFEDSHHQVRTACWTQFPLSPSVPIDGSRFPNLHEALYLDPRILSQLLQDGKSFARISVHKADIRSPTWLADHFKLLQDDFSVGKTLTCLELALNGLTFVSTLAIVAELAQSKIFPNVQELLISYTASTHTQQSTSTDALKLEIQPFLAALLPMPSLRVLNMECGDHDDTTKLPRVLKGHFFPPKLEYLVWRANDEPLAQSFRYISPTSEMRPTIPSPDDAAVMARCVGKVGCLVEIPNMFRQRISAQGVWSQAFIPSWNDPVLDHLQSPPAFNL